MIFLHPVAPWSDAGRAALAARYGNAFAFCEGRYQRRDPFSATLNDLAPWWHTRFHTHDYLGDHDPDSPALAAARPIPRARRRDAPFSFASAPGAAPPRPSPPQMAAGVRGSS